MQIYYQTVGIQHRGQFDLREEDMWEEASECEAEEEKQAVFERVMHGEEEIVRLYGWPEVLNRFTCG